MLSSTFKWSTDFFNIVWGLEWWFWWVLLNWPSTSMSTSATAVSLWKYVLCPAKSLCKLTHYNVFLPTPLSICAPQWSLWLQGYQIVYYLSSFVMYCHCYRGILIGRDAFFSPNSVWHESGCMCEEVNIQSQDDCLLSLPACLRRNSGPCFSETVSTGLNDICLNKEPPSVSPVTLFYITQTRMSLPELLHC